MIILFLLILTFHLTKISSLPCDTYNITHSQQNDNLTINFPSNNLLKLNRTVRCTTASSFESINGCVHHCTQLGYGQRDKISIEMQYDNGTLESCSIDYTIELQPPSLAYLNIINNKVRLGIIRPMNSFDYVQIHCSDDETYILFNTTVNNPIETVDCSLTFNMPLMSFVLETIKQDFNSGVDHIVREVPLPIPFTYSLNSRLLTVQADPPPPINIYSTYEFQILFHDQNLNYERIKISGLNPNAGYTSNYGLIPNFNHTIIFKHIVNSIGYTQSDVSIPAISNILYPFEVTNLHIKEEFNNIILTWNDTHDFFDPIEFVVLCNASGTSMTNVGRNTTYICEQMTFNQTNMITVQTRVAIPGYTHQRIATVQINVAQIPEIPIFEVFNKTVNSITIRWNYDNTSLGTNLFQYKISCGVNQTSIQIDIQSNEYQCQSLVEGTLYIITMFLENIDQTIQRSKSINANTLLEKCQYRNHFYTSDLNGIRSVIIEWQPPDKNFDKIDVHCPSSSLTFEYPQTVPMMFVKCIVTSGIQFTVTFVTIKSGYEQQTLQVTDTAPLDLTTTSTENPTTASTENLTTASTENLTTTSTENLMTTSAENLTTTSKENPSPITASDCSQEGLLNIQAALTRWRIAAIVAFIITGFLILVTICLTIFSALLCLRNRYNNTDE